MVFGIIILDVEEMKLHFSNFYGETANDTKKNLRIKYLMTKLQEGCTQQKEISKEKIMLLNFLKQKDLLTSKYKNELMYQNA